MFFRSKQSGSRIYLQLVENLWKNGKTKQRVIATVGRLDKLQNSNELESLLRSGTKFCKDHFNLFSSIESETYLSSHQVSRLLRVSPSAVVCWIDKGEMPAFRTPGGHRRVKLTDLRDFLRANQMPIPKELGGDTQRKRIFIVDDDPHVIRAIQRSLQQQAMSYVVNGCNNGIEALVRIGFEKPHLVLLDIYMPGLDGFEVCQRLKQIPHLSGISIVAITAHPSDEDRARILHQGAEDYWVKPILGEQIKAYWGEREEQQVPA